MSKPDRNILGTWELVAIYPVPMVESPPFGMPPMRYLFNPDGTLVLIGPEAGGEDRINAGTFKRDGRDVVVTIEMDAVRTLRGEMTAPGIVLNDDDGMQWVLRKMQGDDAQVRPLEPVSVAWMASELPMDAPFDYLKDAQEGDSSADFAQRLTGIWELIGYSNFPPFDIPPYGTPNEKWVFDGQGTCSVLEPNITDPAAGRQFEYAVRNNHFVIDRHQEERHAVIEFNEWGHLILNEDGVSAHFKRLGPVDQPVPAIPLKVVLMRLRDR